MDLEIGNFGIITPGTSLPDLGWDVLYEANALPAAAAPAWSADGDATTIEIFPAGFLHVVSSYDTEVDYLREAAFDNLVGSTMEVRLKVIDAEGGRGFILLDDGILATNVIFTGSKVYVEGYEETDYYDIDLTDDYHTLRITLFEEEANIYIDGILRISRSTATSGSPVIMFASLGISEVADFETSWDYVYYSTGGAFIP